MKDLLSIVHQKAQEHPKRIVFPESEDSRILQAVDEIMNTHVAEPILLGNREQILSDAQKFNLKNDFSTLTIIDPQTERTEQLAQTFFELRKSKGMTLEVARKTLLASKDYYGTMLVQIGDADGMVSGATSSTGDTVRPALQIIKTKEKFHKVSGIFFMVLKDRLLLFADAAVNIEPNSYDLAEIAADTVETAQRFGIEPRVAFLSFSTKGSAEGESVNKVREASAIFKDRHPNILSDGEMQVDAALIPEVAMKKCPKSPLAGTANILIFPDLNSANIAYKLVERLAKAQAVGPILQGLRKPINDLSRGCSVEDIVNLAAFTTCEAQELHYHS